MAESVTLGWTNHGPEPGDMNSDERAMSRMMGLNDAHGYAVWMRSMEDKFPATTERLSSKAWRMVRKGLTPPTRCYNRQPNSRRTRWRTA